MQESIQVLIDFLSANKCKNIALFLNDNGQDEEYIVVASVNNAAENKKLADKFIETFGEVKTEGYGRGEWIIFDLDKVILHTFIATKREKYNLDKLYQNKKINLTSKKEK